MCIRYWPEDKTRNEVVGARVNLYMAAKKWDMAAAVASHLVKVEPQNKAWWINLAYSIRRSEGPSDRDNGDPRCSLRMRRRAVTGPRRAPLRFLRIPTGEAMLPALCRVSARLSDQGLAQWMVTLDEEFVASVEPLQKPETGNTVELAIATAVATPTREHQIPHGIYALETDGFQRMREEVVDVGRRGA